MNKYIKEYNDKYGEIPNDCTERFNYLLKDLSIKEKDIPIINSKIESLKHTEFKRMSFVFYFTPQATPRPRLSRFTQTFYVKNKMNYNDVFRQYLEQCGELENVICTPCKFLTRTFVQTPSSMPKIEKILAELMLIPNISRPDWDNYGKTYSDMIQKHLILDDSLIYDGRVTKYFSIKPRVEIYIEYMDYFNSTYNEKKIKSWLNFKNSTTR